MESVIGRSCSALTLALTLLCVVGSDILTMLIDMVAQLHPFPRSRMLSAWGEMKIMLLARPEIIIKLDRGGSRSKMAEARSCRRTMVFRR